MKVEEKKKEVQKAQRDLSIPFKETPEYIARKKKKFGEDYFEKQKKAEKAEAPDAPDLPKEGE